MSKPPPQPESPVWKAEDLRDDPHQTADKAARVRRMFSDIAGSYDLNNRIHSLGRDRAWRKAAVKLAEIQPDERVLDCACGTGDLTLAFAQQMRGLGAEPLTEGQITGLDFTEEMLALSIPKAKNLLGAEMAAKLEWVQGDALALPFQEASFEVVSIAFGLRNVAEPAKAFAEFFRVLKPGGRLIVLEFGVPRFAPMRWLYMSYFRHVLPRTAALVARDRSGAYAYLPRSVETFLDRAGIEKLYRQAGFDRFCARSLTQGICWAFRADKPSEPPSSSEKP